ncbi:pyridoxal-phosphate dependent enzyme [Streptomyces sp. TS71-3]|uniref:pyridoxal-phosphate dependent enzyme n=1 Tax=Streptomyces sp. TS71-3 TaxID=2733862 RepID=UPI001B20E1DF|nr:pyridoxal-phosphate dependent enzyme [Streptomyces sp. TS71-3]GHJ42617.1 D-cysteine desulfhydrase [Streptomyces sp. TS71-3]
MNTAPAASGSPSRVPLGTWPTPVEPLPRLAAELGLGPEDLLVKRDDLTGLGGGGNKVRKLEWTVAAALTDGADTLVTTGAPQSNHARLTAAAAARLGLASVLVFPGTADGSRSGNLVLDGLFGARIVWSGASGREAHDRAAADVCERLREEGARPALIPFGGSSALGARGYVRCGQELLEQVPDARTAVVAVGSGGTMAGLVASLGTERVLGVDTGALDDPVGVIRSFAAGLTSEPLGPDRIRVRGDQVGAGYGTLTEPVKAALELAARTEGVVLDPIYTGRAMAGLIAAVREGAIRPGERTVFVHTGGMAGLFGHPDAVAFGEGLVRAGG